MGFTTRKRKARKVTSAKARANARSTVKVRLVGNPASATSSSSAGGGGAGSTVIFPQQQQQLPIPSTALPSASPLGPMVDDLRRTIRRLESQSTAQQQEFQDRINRVAASLAGDLTSATQGVRDQLLSHINDLTNQTGAHLGDIRQAVLNANAAADAARQQTDALRTDASVFAQRVSQDIGGVAQGVQQVAAETQGLRQETGQFAAQAANEIGRTNQRVVQLQDETGAIGQAVLSTDAQRAADAQVLASELVRTQQGLVDAELRRQAGDAGLADRMGAMGEMAGDIFRDIYGRFQGVHTDHGPGQGDAGGLAAMSGGSTQRHLGGGYGNEPPRRTFGLPGPSNQLQNGGVGDDTDSVMSDL